MKKHAEPNGQSRRELSEQQQAAVELLVAGKMDKEAASALKLPGDSVAKWRMHDPVFLLPRADEGHAMVIAGGARIGAFRASLRTNGKGLVVAMLVLGQRDPRTGGHESHHSER
jgi:hypothetical protein